MEVTMQKVGELLPLLESWLRSVVNNEVQNALEADREKAKPERHLTRDEVCKLLHISKPTLWQKTKAGEITATHIGRRVLYAESEIKRFLEG